MKHLLIVLLLTTSLSSMAQVTGSYYNSFGSRITLNADSTFNYKWNFDLASSWNNGKWQIKNDTIYFKPVFVYDTIKIKDEKEFMRDRLVLSIDQKSESITLNDYVSYLLVSGGQSAQDAPAKLFYHENKLYEITTESKLLKKKVKGFMTRKKVVPWYRKIKDE